MLTLLTGANKSILTEKTKRSINLSNAIPGHRSLALWSSLSLLHQLHRAVCFRVGME